MKARKLFLLCMMGAVVQLFYSCGSSSSLPTSWRSTEIIIDGKSSDWQNKLHEIPDQKIWVGFVNDDKFLYMTLISDDRSKVMQMMRAGFITWFIPSNSENTFGIKFPLPAKFNPREQMPSINREMFQQGGGLENLVKMFLDKQNELQVVNSEKFSLSLMPIDNQDGIKAKLGYQENKFIYELQIPLAVHDDFPFQVTSLPGDDLKIKFETEQPENDMMRGIAGGMQRGGQAGGQMRGNMPGGRFGISEPLNYSLTIKLSQK